MEGLFFRQESSLETRYEVGKLIRIFGDAKKTLEVDEEQSLRELDTQFEELQKTFDLCLQTITLSCNYFCGHKIRSTAAL